MPSWIQNLIHRGGPLKTALRVWGAVSRGAESRGVDIGSVVLGQFCRIDCDVVVSFMSYSTKARTITSRHFQSRFKDAPLCATPAWRLKLG